MGSLLLEVLTGPMMVTVGRAQIDNLTSLNLNRSIKGFFPVLSADSEHVAELKISLALVSIMGKLIYIEFIKRCPLLIKSYVPTPVVLIGGADLMSIDHVEGWSLSRNRL